MSDTTTSEHLIALERAALDRWGNGDPSGFLELYGTGITYFDPLVMTRLDGHATMAEYYRPWIGLIRVSRYEMPNTRVVVDGDMAVLTYNLVNYVTDAEGFESVGSRWNSTVVYQRRDANWKSIHSHWSFTSHPAFQTMTAADTENSNG